MNAEKQSPDYESIPTLIPPPDPDTAGLGETVRKILEEIRDFEERPTLIPDANITLIPCK